jgi:hypothetical protein
VRLRPAGNEQDVTERSAATPVASPVDNESAASPEPED